MLVDGLFFIAPPLAMLVSPLPQCFPQHVQYPYPTETERHHIIKATGIEMKQLTNWFTNNRKRLWKPKANLMNVRWRGACAAVWLLANAPIINGLLLVHPL